MADQPEALRLADSLTAGFGDCGPEAAAELRRLHDETLMLEGAYESACKILSEQDKKLAELEAVNQELLAALNNIEVSTHDAMTAALARAAIAKVERNKT
jgi:Tfp pilus assembly PilM family ATPase